jgi:hypothetical protein
MTTLDLMLELSDRRARSWKNIELRSLPDPYGLHEAAILGTYSYALLTSRVRLLIKSSLIELDEEHREPPPVIARDYLRAKYKRGPINKKNQIEAIEDGTKPVPIFAAPGKFTEGYYIDIKSAYWSIMKIVGWNPDYYPGKWIAPGEPPSDFPFPEHKIARNCLVSAGVPGKMLQYKPTGQFYEVGGGSPLKNPGLFRLISDVLNSIAHTARREYGALYVNNDGFIAPSHKSAAQIVQLIKNWGLTPTIKAEGPGAVRSAGAYQVGKMTSIPFKMRVDNLAVSIIHRPAYADWLEENFSYWAAENQD